MQALAKDVPWRLKGPRVLEIIEAVCYLGLPVCQVLLLSVCGVC